MRTSENQYHDESCWTFMVCIWRDVWIVMPQYHAPWKSYPKTSCQKMKTPKDNLPPETTFPIDMPHAPWTSDPIFIRPHKTICPVKQHAQKDNIPHDKDNIHDKTTCLVRQHAPKGNLFDLKAYTIRQKSP